MAAGSKGRHIQPCDTIALNNLTSIVFCKFSSLMSAQERNYYYEKVCVFDRNHVDQRKSVFWHIS